MELFDISKAVKYIRASISEPAQSLISDDDLEVIIDLIMDYYEDNGLLELESDVEDPELTVVSEYVSKRIVSLEPEYEFLSNIPEIVDAEYKYEQTLFN